MTKNLLLSFLITLICMPVMAVTDKEMDQAKAITAKAYLRWANDGSGYLDDVNATSMSQLTSKLKSKEKENLEAFNSVPVPADYAGWDKAKLVEFWSVTFFTSPKLDANGKRAKGVVKTRLQAMNVAAPAKEKDVADEPAKKNEKNEDIKKEEVKEDTKEAEPTQPTEDGALDEGAYAVEETSVVEDATLKDQNAQAQDADAKKAEVPAQEKSNTWVYVVVLLILIGIVVWLVFYAAKLMKRQPEADDKDRGETEFKRADSRKEIAKRDKEVAELQRRLEAEENRNADLSMELERLKLEKKRLEDQLRNMRNPVNRVSKSDDIEPAELPRTTRRTTHTETQERRRQSVAMPERRSNRAASDDFLKVIYLGRANSRGIFVRADRKLNPGNTIYRLDTSDGLVGTFKIVDDPNVIDFALTDPSIYLANGCTGENLNDTDGVTDIITESAGTAIFENGYWKILRKSIIRYE